MRHDAMLTTCVAFVAHRGASLTPDACAVLGFAGRAADALGLRLAAVLVGADAAAATEDAIAHGAHMAIAISDARLGEYDAELYSSALDRAAHEVSAAIVCL